MSTNSIEIICSIVSITSRTPLILCSSEKILPLYLYPFETIRTDGSTWPNRSTTPCEPKSGEHEVQTAPVAVAASMRITVSTQLGTKAAILVPLVIPISFNPYWAAATDSFNSPNVRILSFRPSPVLIIAT